MKPPPWLLFGLFATASTVAPAVERLPAELFAREPLTSRARLAPDGKHLAFLRDLNGRFTLHVADLENNQLTRLDLGDAARQNDLPKDAVSFLWASDRRLVITTAVTDRFYGVVAADWDGNKATPISGYEDPKVKLEVTGNIAMTSMRSVLRETIHAFNDKDQNILMLDRHELGGGGGFSRPDIVRVNTLTGVAMTVLKNPGEVAHYGLDFNGVARLGILSHGELSGAIYRAGEKEEWKTILPLKKREGQMHPLGLDAANERLFVSDLTGEKRWAVFSLDPATGALGEPLLSDPEYDIIPERYSPSIDGVYLTSPIFSESKKTLIGIRYYTEAPRVKWFDKDFSKYQAAVDKAMPNTVNLLVDQSDDGKKLLWFGFSDQHPGEYRLLDLEKKSFKTMGLVRPWINPAQMAQTLAIKYPARDGLVIHGYLTVPAGYPPKGLPLVVLPHGGPWVRDVWGFDALVQLIANRGYAVLQMNYRGSTGYGDTLYQEARRQIGGEIQDDIEDATRWAIATGVADPKRIAIFGGSYGGYSALFALGHNPELYRCGISLAGVTDWYAIYTQSDVADYKESTRYWREQIGDPKKDKEMLKAISPVYFAEKITAPTLIIQGKEDRRVPPAQARAMIAALEKAGHKPESLFLGRVGHNLGHERDRKEIYESIVAFLEKNLGPGCRDQAKSNPFLTTDSTD